MQAFKLSLSIWIILRASSLLASPETSERISLHEAVQSALTNNPQMQSLKSSWQSSRWSVSANEPLLSPPELVLGTMGRENIGFGDRMESTIGVQQKLGFPTKVLAQRKALSEESEAQKYSLLTFELELKRETTKSFFYYLESVQKKALLVELQKIYREHLSRLRSAAIQDQMMRAHIISAQNETDEIANGLLLIEENETIARGRLNILMGRDAFATLGLPEPPASLSKLPDTEQFLDLLKTHPEYSRLESAVNAASARKQAAAAAWLPDFMLSYEYHRRHDAMPDYSEVMLGLSLPFLTFWQPRAKSAEAQTQLESLRKMKLSQEQLLSLQVLSARTQLERLSRQLETYHKKLIPQSKQRIDLLRSLSPTDQTTLTEYREALQQYVKARLDALEKRTEYESSFAELESLLPGLNKVIE